MALTEAEELELLELEALEAEGATTPQEPSLLRKAAQVATTPIRGFRGLGVTTQKLVEGAPLQESLQRGAEATKPGYEAQPGEKIGAAVGGMAPFLPLAAIGGVPAALIAGGSNVAEQFSEKGKVEPIEAAASTLLAGLGKPVAKAGVGVTKAGVKLAKLGNVRPTEVVGKEIEALERASGARAKDFLKEQLPKVGKTVEKARTDIDKIGATLAKAQEKGIDLSAKWVTRQKDRVGLILDKFLPKPGEVTQAGRSLGQDAIKKASQIKEILSQKLGGKLPERIPLAKEFAKGKQKEAVMKALEQVPIVGRPIKTIRKMGKILEK